MTPVQLTSIASNPPPVKVHLVPVDPHVSFLSLPATEELAYISIPAPFAVVSDAFEVEPIPTVLSATFKDSVLIIVCVPSTLRLPVIVNAPPTVASELTVNFPTVISGVPVNP